MALMEKEDRAELKKMGAKAFAKHERAEAKMAEKEEKKGAKKHAAKKAAKKHHKKGK